MRHYHNSHLSFIDMLFNALTVFAALFILSVMIINDPSEKNSKKVDERAKIMITMTWDDNSPDDMDLWLLPPSGEKVGFNSPNGNIANLARDDLGKQNDWFTDSEGHQQFIHLNKEIITIREKAPGHYVVNVMFYGRLEDPEFPGRVTAGPQEITVQITEIDPRYREVVTKKIILDNPHDEKTAVSFDILSDGTITNIDDETQVPFIRNEISDVIGRVPGMGN